MQSGGVERIDRRFLEYQFPLAPDRAFEPMDDHVALFVGLGGHEPDRFLAKRRLPLLQQPHHQALDREAPVLAIDADRRIDLQLARGDQLELPRLEQQRLQRHGITVQLAEEQRVEAAFARRAGGFDHRRLGEKPGARFADAVVAGDPCLIGTPMERLVERLALEVGVQRDDVTRRNRDVVDRALELLPSAAFEQHRRTPARAPCGPPDDPSQGGHQLADVLLGRERRLVGAERPLDGRGGDSVQQREQTARWDPRRRRRTVSRRIRHQPELLRQRSGLEMQPRVAEVLGGQADDAGFRGLELPLDRGEPVRAFLDLVGREHVRLLEPQRRDQQ
jgi:hypothetical protein